MQSLPYRIVASWDEDAKVWVTAASDVPGWIIESETLENFALEARTILPDLLQAQGVLNGATELPMSLVAERNERIPLNV